MKETDTGTDIAATTLGGSPASVSNEVRCYSVAQVTDDPHQYTDMTQASATSHAAPDGSATTTAALDACSGLWQIGIIQPGRVDSAAAVIPGNYVAPPLAARVLPGGEAAVFPGDSTTCARLDLQTLTNRE